MLELSLGGISACGAGQEAECKSSSSQRKGNGLAMCVYPHVLRRQ
ncbi:hypothetical protein LEMLEM_LOCUS3956, partial [Lemmus lemmus]